VAKNILSQDSKGNYKRDLGRMPNGKQRRFYLGRDKTQAEKRAMKLERLWALVEAQWQSLRQRDPALQEKWQKEIERGEWQCRMERLEEVKSQWRELIAAPHWDSVTLAIAEAIRKGESACVLRYGDHYQSWMEMDSEKAVFHFVDSSPEAQLKWLRRLQEAYPIITLKLGDQDACRQGVELAQKRKRMWQRFADREARLASPQEHAQRLHAALDSYSEWIEKTHRTPPPESRVKQSGMRLIFHVRKIKEAQSDLPLSGFNSATIDGMIEYWKNRPLTKKGTPASPETVKGIIKTIRHFIRWLNRNSTFHWQKPADLEILPVRITLTPAENARKLRTLQVETYSLDELVMLYQYATGLERLLLLLGLNCGFGQAEIASLQTNEIHLDERHPHYAHLHGSWIRRIRLKSSVYGEWMLWEESVQGIRWMMERRGTQKDGALILTKAGRELTNVINSCILVRSLKSLSSCP
jgi:hypothetical protein